MFEKIKRMIEEIKEENRLSNQMLYHPDTSPFRMAVGFSDTMCNEIVLYGNEREIKKYLDSNGEEGKVVVFDRPEGTFLIDCAKMYNYEFSSREAELNYHIAARAMNDTDEAVRTKHGRPDNYYNYKELYESLEKDNNLLMMYIGYLLEYSIKNSKRIDMWVYDSVKSFGDTNVSTSYSAYELKGQSANYTALLEEFLNDYKKELAEFEDMMSLQLETKESEKKRKELKERVQNLEELLMRDRWEEDLEEGVIADVADQRKLENRYEMGAFADWQQFNLFTKAEGVEYPATGYTYYFSDDKGIKNIIAGAIANAKAKNANMKQCYCCKKMVYVRDKRNPIFCSGECREKYNREQKRLRDAARTEEEKYLKNVREKFTRRISKIKNPSILVNAEMAYAHFREVANLKKNRNIAGFFDWCDEMVEQFELVCDGRMSENEYLDILNSSLR